MPAEFNAKDLNKKNSNKPQSTTFDAASLPESDDELMWELLSLYADGEASQEEAAQVEQMLRHDAEYARAYTFMQQAGGAIRTIVEIEPPAHLRDAILAKTTRKPTFAQRAAVVFGAFRVQLAAPVGRLAFAGGGLAATALVIGIYAGRSGDAPDVRQPANESVATTTSAAKPKTSLPVDVPVYKLPEASEIVKASTPLSNDAAKPEMAKNPVTAAKPSKVPTPVIPFGPSMALAGSGVSPAPVVKQTKLSLAPAPLKNSGRAIALNNAKSSRQTEARIASDSSGTQNVNPMMDAAVQHRAAPMVIASIGSGGASGMKNTMADMDDLNDNNVLTVHETTSGATAGSTDGDTLPEGGRKIVGKLMLSKLPPSARHLMSPAEAIREANSRSLINYSAASSEEMPRRSADVPVLKGSF